MDIQYLQVSRVTVQACNPRLERWRQEDQEGFKVIVGYMRPCLRNNNKNQDKHHINSTTHVKLVKLIKLFLSWAVVTKKNNKYFYQFSENFKLYFEYIHPSPLLLNLSHFPNSPNLYLSPHHLFLNPWVQLVLPISSWMCGLSPE